MRKQKPLIFSGLKLICGAEGSICARPAGRARCTRVGGASRKDNWASIRSPFFIPAVQLSKLEFHRSYFDTLLLVRKVRFAPLPVGIKNAPACGGGPIVLSCGGHEPGIEHLVALFNVIENTQRQHSQVIKFPLKRM